MLSATVFALLSIEVALTIITQYCTDATYGKHGFVDNLLALEIADDAARAQWGQQWLMPTEEQINELRDECTWEHYTLNSVLRL